MNAVIVNNVTKVLNGRKVLNHVSLTIPDNTIVGIVGRNGSGKSMLLKAISGLMPVTEGHISVFGENVGKNGAFPANIGVLIEQPGLLPQYSGMQNLRLIAGIRRVIGDRNIEMYMKELGLDPKDRRPVRKYSMGMKQKVGIIQAVMEQPKLLILDEPMNNLDQESMICVRKIIQRIRSEGSTVILCSHNTEDIEGVCDHVYMMCDGCINRVGG